MPSSLSAALEMAYARVREPDREQRELASGTRVALTRRREDLALALAPAPRDRIILILALLDGMSTRAETDSSALALAMERDITDLSDLPEFALAAAARDYRRGIVGDGKWRPTAGQLAILAREKAQPLRAELHRIDRVLKAPALPKPPPVGPARRKELADKIRALASGFAP